MIVYTRGHGRLFCSLKGYQPCRNPEEVIDSCGYDSEAGYGRTDRVCILFSRYGFYVKWNQVEEYMHTESREKAVSKEKQTVVYRVASCD